MTDLTTLTDEPSEPFVFHGHHAKRAYTRAQNIRKFVGVDGEGITYDDPSGKKIIRQTLRLNLKTGFFNYEEYLAPKQCHDYVLLSAGDESLHHDGSPLSLDDILQFLWDLHEPDVVYVGYYLGYDYTEWLKDLPMPVARDLLTDEGIASRAVSGSHNPRPNPVAFGKWLIDILPMKRFRFKERGADEFMYICDMGPFFQTSFVKTLEKWRKTDPNICSKQEFRNITEGKARRNEAVFDLEMVRYNQLENRILARVAVKLNEGFSALGIHLKKDQWFGPGQAAQEFLKQVGAPLAVDVQKWVPEEVLRWAIESYYGGWSEAFCHGHISGTTYQYDRNSAYPYETVSLPCLKCGTWKPVKTVSQRVDALYLCDVTVRQRKNNNGRLGSMPYRAEQGQILRPRNVRGVYWWKEIEAAKKAGCIDSVEIHGAWEFTSECNHAPFAPVAKLYERRRSVGKDTPLGIAIKLVINSIYGKLAQSVGNPKFANPIYASLITSGCRVAIWEAIGSHPGGTTAVVMVATDAVFFRSEHRGLQLSDRLGDWSKTEKQFLTIHMPGIYWDEATRESDDGAIKTRGFRAVDLRGSIHYLDERWTEFSIRATDFHISRTRKATVAIRHFGHPIDKEYEWFSSGHWPEAIIPVKFGLVSAKLALHRNAWWQAGQILSTERHLMSYPMMKRDGRTLYVEDGICWTLPYKKGPHGLRSTPYNKRFGMELKDKLLENDIVSQSNRTDIEFYEWLGSKPEDMMELVE